MTPTIPTALGQQPPPPSFCNGPSRPSGLAPMPISHTGLLIVELVRVSPLLQIFPGLRASPGPAESYLTHSVNHPTLWGSGYLAFWWGPQQLQCLCTCHPPPGALPHRSQLTHRSPWHCADGPSAQSGPSSSLSALSSLVLFTAPTLPGSQSHRCCASLPGSAGSTVKTDTASVLLLATPLCLAQHLAPQVPVNISQRNE